MGDLVGEIVVDSFNYEVVELDEKQKAKLSQKLKKVRKAMFRTQEEQHKELPRASGEIMIIRFDGVG